MASEAGVADHPTSSEAQEVHEEVKACEPEIISPAEVEKPELDSLPVPVAPLSESEDKIEAKPIQAPKIEELKERDEEEKTKDEKLPTPIAPIADAEEKVEGKNIESSVVTQEKITVEEEMSIVEVEPTSEEKLKSEDFASPTVVLAEEVQPLASEVLPSIAPESKVEDKSFEPSIIELNVASETHVAAEAKIVAEPPLVEENIVTEPFVVEEKLVQSLVTEEEKNATESPVVEEKISTQTPLVEDKLVQTSVVEEEKDTIEALAVEDKLSTETPVVEDKLVQTPEIEVADDTIEKLVLETKTEAETPIIEEAKITAEPPVVEEKIVIEPLPVEKILHTFAVKEAEETNEPLVTNEEILSEVGQENLVQAPVVEETKVMTEKIIDDKMTATEASETEEGNIDIEPPLMKEKFETDPPVEEKNVKIPIAEETRNSAETPIVQEVKSMTETPLVVGENYATGAPLVEQKIMTEPSVDEKLVAETPVEEKIVENPVVGGSKNKTETPNDEEVKNETKPPVVEEENDAIEAPIAEEEKSFTEPPVVEAANHISESFVPEEVKKAINTPDAVVSVKNESIVAQDCAAETDSPDVSEPEAKIAETKPVTDNSKSQEAEETKVELVEVKLGENEKTDDILELSTKIDDKKEEEVIGPVKDSEQELVKDEEIPEPQSIEEEVYETSTTVVDEAQVHVVVEAQKSVEVPKQDESTEESSVEAISLGEALLPTKEDQPDAKEEISAGKAGLDEELPKQEAHTLMKVEAENEVRDVKAEDCSQLETTEAEEVIKSIPTIEVAENLSEGIISSRDTEPVAENGNKDKKSESVTPAETGSNGTMEDKTSEKPDDNTLEKPDAEEKGEDTVPAHETKDLDDKATLQDLPQEVVTVQSTQKQSKTILSKVKNTFVKAKKAITGKSNGKTPSFDPKGEIKV